MILQTPLTDLMPSMVSGADAARWGSLAGGSNHLSGGAKSHDPAVSRRPEYVIASSACTATLPSPRNAADLGCFRHRQRSAWAAQIKVFAADFPSSAPQQNL